MSRFRKKKESAMSVTEEAQNAFADPSAKVDGWRLLNLIDAYRARKEPLDLEDVEELGKIAHARSDLHDACRALSAGCSLEHAVNIFT